jgi:hypothetical protein
MPTNYCAHGSDKQRLHLLGLRGSNLRLDNARWRTAAQTLSGTSLHRTAYLSDLESVESES